MVSPVGFWLSTSSLESDSYYIEQVLTVVRSLSVFGAVRYIGQPKMVVYKGLFLREKQIFSLLFVVWSIADLQELKSKEILVMRHFAFLQSCGFFFPVGMGWNEDSTSKEELASHVWNPCYTNGPNSPKWWYQLQPSPYIVFYYQYCQHLPLLLSVPTVVSFTSLLSPSCSLAAEEHECELEFVSSISNVVKKKKKKSFTNLFYICI